MNLLIKRRSLILTDLANDCTIVVDKPRYLIGRGRNSVDGAITYSKYVAKIHCQIVNKEDGYYIYDHYSTNGTFVNGVQIEPEKGILLKAGDTLQIADVKFKVGYEEA